MFKTLEQVQTFVDKIEKFTLAVINNKNSNDVSDAIALNKRRDELQNFIEIISGLGPAADTTDSYSCPECGHDMKLRTNRSNGNKFWGCVKYPDCKGTRDENGLSRAEREEAKVIKEQQSGFSFNRDKRNPVTEVSPETGWVNPFRK